MCGMSCIEILKQWRLWIRPVVMSVYGLILIVLLPVLVVKAINSGFTKEVQGILIGGVFAMLALPISLWEITQHMVHYTKPFLQKHIIRILWMVPIYAMNAWLGLVFPEQSIYLDTLRECYEAYVIYNFMMYLLRYLNSEMDLEANLELKPQVKHIFPFCFLTSWKMGGEFVHMCKHGILQYTVVRPVTTFISFICEMNKVYGEGEFRADAAYPYMIAISNFSQFIAMYCLVLFYRANRAELQPMQPFGKFLCIKAVVFFSFFQGVVISILVYTGVISSAFNTKNTDSSKDIASKLQDFLICFEMFVAAIAHAYSFSYKPFVNTEAEQFSCCSAFLAMWDVSDVQQDIKEHLEVVGTSLSRHIRGRGMYQYAPGSVTESSRLLMPEPPSTEDEGAKSAPARLGVDRQNGYYSSMSPPNYAAIEATNYPGVEQEPQPGSNQSSVVSSNRNSIISRDEASPLIDLSDTSPHTEKSLKMPNEYGKYGRTFHGKLIGLDIDLNESIDFKFFEAEDNEDPIYGPKPSEGKDLKNEARKSNKPIPKNTLNDEKEQDSTQNLNTLTSRSGKSRELMNCIAFENEEACNKDNYIHDEWNETNKPDDLDSLSTDTTSDITDITPRPSSSGCSSMSKMESDKEVKAKRSSRKPKHGRSDFNKQKGSMKLLKDAVENLEREDRISTSSSSSDRKKYGRGRFSMTFTNEELEKIDQENHHLLKKIEGNHNRKHTKQGLLMLHPRLSSAAINRQKQQRMIEYENLILLRKIENAKGTTMTLTGLRRH